jgi:hypothetical protein
MKNILLLLLICCFLLAACSIASKSNTLEMARVGHETEVEALPVAADLRVLEQKATGEAIGKIAMRAELEMEALAKALGQDPPSVDKPDVLVGANVFTEKWSDSLKVTVTGYPAYYANFRTATEEDILRLGIVRLGARPILPSSDKAPEALTARTTETADKAPQERESTIDNYFTLRYMLPVSEGITAGNINIGGGWAWKSGNFVGLELGLTPFSIFGDEWSAGGGMNFGRVFDLQYFQLFGGLSAGFWLAEKRKTIQVAGASFGLPLSYHNEDVYFDKVNVLGAFIGGRWNILELTYRIFPDIFELSKGVYPMEGDGWHHQFMIGINI